jgi:hypothetical protein
MDPGVVFGPSVVKDPSVIAGRRVVLRSRGLSAQQPTAPGTAFHRRGEEHGQPEAEQEGDDPDPPTHGSLRRLEGHGRHCVEGQLGAGE